MRFVGSGGGLGGGGGGAVPFFKRGGLGGGGEGKGRGGWRCSSFDLGADLEWVVSEDELVFFYHGRKGNHERENRDEEFEMCACSSRFKLYGNR